jgi:xylulokinase
MTHVVGIDVGTTGVKGLAIDPDGQVAARAEATYQLSTPRPGWAEQDPVFWGRATETVLADLKQRTNTKPDGIGLSGQMHGLVALDANDAPLRPAILWNDQRTAAQTEEIERTLGRERLIELTGNRALTGFTAPKLLWLREHEPATYERIKKIALPKDYVRLKLTGEHATDVADASGTLVLNVAKRQWSEEVLEALHFDPDWLPRVLESPETSGHTKDGIPVAAGAGDQAAGALGVGVVEPGPVSVVLGTSGVVFAALNSFAADPQGRVHAFCHAVPGKWHAMGVMLSAAGSLRWLRDTIAPEIGYDQLLKEAEGWPPGTEGLTFLPYLAGERTPHADPDARGAFVGLSVRHDRGALVRAVLEGVAFGLRDSLDLIAELGQDPQIGRVSGGGARGDTWLQIVASVLELPLERVQVDEGAAYGAALLAGTASRTFSDIGAAATNTVRPQHPIDPVPEWVEVYREERAKFQALYPALKNIG